MTKRTRVRIDDSNVDGRLANKAQMLVDLISPKDLYFIGGRALAKTSGIIAQRSQKIIHDMPGSYQMFVSDTYMNALTNVLPALIEGWQRMGWREGIHFVTDKRPPSHFKLPYKPPLHYKHTISIFNGTFFNLGSLDQPSGLAGSSYQHRFGDEARLLKKKGFYVKVVTVIGQDFTSEATKNLKRIRENGDIEIIDTKKPWI